MAAGDLARRAFASMKGGEGSDEGEAESKGGGGNDAGAAAGRKLKAALDSGDGTRIYQAFEALMGECNGGMSEEEGGE